MKPKSFAGLLVSVLVFPVLSFGQMKPKVTYFHEENLLIPHHKFLFKRLPTIKFVPFDRSYFKIPITQETVKLTNGKTLPVQRFLQELNQLEKEFNKFGYTLRDEKPITIHFIYPKEQLKLQRETLLKALKTFSPPLQVPCEDKGEIPTQEMSTQTGRPKDFVPLDWEQNWDFSFGNADFGVNLTTSMKIRGEEQHLDINPFFDAAISFLGHKIDVLKIEKSGNNLIGKLMENRVFEQSLSSELKGVKLFDDLFEWSTGSSFSIGPINVSGKFGFKGNARIEVNGKFDPSSNKVKGTFSPYLRAEAFGELGANFEIVRVAVDGNLILMDEVANLEGRLELVKSSNQYFQLSASGKNTTTLLKGRLYVFAEIGLPWGWGTRKIEVELFDSEGVSFDRILFSINKSVPAEKDHYVWLTINNISGITPNTARKEKLEIEPQEFDVIVEIGGNRYFKTVKDYNRDGRYGRVFGEYEPLRYEVPLLSFKKVPIGIEVIERYQIGTLDFKTTLDFAKGIWRKVELCYDPKTGTFSGTKSGGENEEIRSVGDSRYWGERYHQIIFELTTKGGFKAAPAKAK